MTILLLLITLGLVIYSLLRQGKVAVYDPRDIYHPKTAKETLEELRAQEILSRDYDFITPNYGMYKGQKIPLSQITRAMKEDATFSSPQALGKWVRKKQQ